MINDKYFLDKISRLVGPIKKNKFVISVRTRTAEISLGKIALLTVFLERFSRDYHVIIENIPYCLMPGYSDNLVHKKDPGARYSYNATCHKCAYFDICPGWPEKILINRNYPQGIRDIPREIVLEITDACNSDCLTCRIDKGIKPSFMSLEKIRKTTDECKILGIGAVRFTGGEPLLHPEIEGILRLAKKRHFYTLLNSNADLLDKKMLGVMEGTVDNILLSLQAYDQCSHNRLTRSSSSFADKIKNLAEVCGSNIPRVRIGSVISKTLVDNIDKYYGLLKNMRVDIWELYRPVRKTALTEFQITQKEILTLMRKIYRFKQKGMSVTIANPVPFCVSPDMNLSLSTMLGGRADDGHSRMILDVRGYLKPSYFIDEDLGSSIKEAWHNPLIKRLRSKEFLIPRCKKCPYVLWCCGGSRAAAKFASNDYFSADPLIPGRA